MANKIYDLIIYRKMTNPYARFIEVESGLIWDVANAVLSATPTYADTDVQLTVDNTYIGGTPVKIPTAMPPGDFDMLIYDSAAIAVADEVIIGKRICWGGTKLLCLPISL